MEKERKAWEAERGELFGELPIVGKTKGFKKAVKAVKAVAGEEAPELKKVEEEAPLIQKVKKQVTKPKRSKQKYGVPK